MPVFLSLKLTSIWLNYYVYQITPYVKRPAFPQDVSKNMEVILTDQNARIRTGGSLLRLMLPPAG